MSMSKYLVPQIDRETFLENNKLKSSIQAAEILAGYIARDLEFNDRTGQWFLYGHLRPGVWSPVSDIFLMSFLQNIFRELNLLSLVPSPTYFVNIKNQLQCHKLVLRSEYPSNPRDYFVFKNCVLTPYGPRDHSREPRCYAGFPYEYLPDAECPHFLEFINNFCSSYSDRIELVRAFMRCCLESLTHVQKFVEFVGEGRTGKSTMQTLLISLVGFENAIVTSLKDLNSNIFEASNLQNKKLIVVSDTEHYTGSVSVLKMITGNDVIMGRRKHLQEGFNIIVEGMVAIFGNYPMYPRDATTLRRLVQFPATQVVPKGREKVLIRIYPDGSVSGILSSELSGIFNWVMKIERESSVQVLSSPEEFVPSLSFSMYRGAISANSIASWVESELVPGEGLYVGGAHMDKPQTLMAFPLYLDYCKRQGVKSVSLKVFSTTLISIIRSQFSHVFKNVSYVRKRLGTYIEGIAVNPIVLDPDYRRGGLVAPQWSPSSLDTSVPAIVQDSPVLLTEKVSSEVEGPSV